MEVALIDYLKQFGPLGVIGGLAFFLLRKEIGQFVSAPRGDRALETLMQGMNEMFAENLRYFEKVESHTNRIAQATESTAETQHQIVTELARRTR
jgi:hypothetical protein